MEERGIPRPQYKVFYKNNEIGIVTSGTQSLMLNHGIGLAYVDIPFNRIGQNIYIQIRNKRLKAIIVKPPFILCVFCRVASDFNLDLPVISA